MAERINVPSDSWLNSKFFLKESVSLHHVVDDVLVVGAGLISSTPASVGKLESSLLDQLLHLLLSFWGLSPIPHCEEFHFNIGEHSLWVLEQLVNDGVKDESNVSVLGILVSSGEILVNCLDPAYVIVSMGHEMNVESLLVLVGSGLDLIRGSEPFLDIDLILPLVKVLNLPFDSTLRFTHHSRIIVVLIGAWHLIPVLDIIALHMELMQHRPTLGPHHLPLL